MFLSRVVKDKVPPHPNDDFSRGLSARHILLPLPSYFAGQISDILSVRAIDFFLVSCLWTWLITASKVNIRVGRQGEGETHVPGPVNLLGAQSRHLVILWGDKEEHKSLVDLCLHKASVGYDISKRETQKNISSTKDSDTSPESILRALSTLCLLNYSLFAPIFTTKCPSQAHPAIPWN